MTFCLFILCPALDSYIIHTHRTEGIDKCTSQTGIRNQRYIQVNGSTTDFIPIT
jgi:hypothetical protein